LSICTFVALNFLVVATAATRKYALQQMIIQASYLATAAGYLTFAAVAKYPRKHTKGVLWMAAWHVARGNKEGG